MEHSDTSPLLGYTLSNVVTVGALGLPDSDRRVLTSIFALSSKRTPRYVLLDKSETKQADLLLVFSDDIKSVDYGKHWNASRQRPVIIVGFATPRLHTNVISRPLNISKVLASLDGSTEELRHAVLTANPARSTQTQTAQASQNTIDIRSITAPMNPTTQMVDEKPADEKPIYNTETLRVLVVDDSKAVQIYMTDKLKRWSIEPVIAGLGEEAIWACAKHQFDVIFLDIQMPGMDGYQTCKKIKSDPSQRNAKVFMLTSRSGTFDKVRGKLAGCDLYLTKPVDPARLIEVVEAEILRKRNTPPHTLPNNIGTVTTQLAASLLVTKFKHSAT